MGDNKLRSTYHSKALCAQEALQYRTKMEFKAGSTAAYVMAVRKGWLAEICAHMGSPFGNSQWRRVYLICSRLDRKVYAGLTYHVVRRMSSHKLDGTEAVKALLSGPHRVFTSKLMPQDEAAALEKSVIGRLKAKGYDVLNVSAGGQVGGARRKWTLEGIRAEAAKYKTRRAFWEGSCSAHKIACLRGWIDDVCAHMPKDARRREHRLVGCVSP